MQLKVVDSVCNLGVTLERQLALSCQVSTLCQSGFYQQRQMCLAVRHYQDRHLSCAIWTTATPCCMVGVTASSGTWSHSQILLHIWSLVLNGVIKSYQFCSSYTDCQSGDGSTTKWHIWCTSRCHAQHQGTWLMTSTSPPTAVVAYFERTLASVTEASNISYGQFQWRLKHFCFRIRYSWHIVSEILHHRNILTYLLKTKNRLKYRQFRHKQHLMF